MTTMKEIAAAVGVSTATVSLVLNGRDKGRVKAALAEHVRRTAEELGYWPNAIARSLRTNRSRMLGFISVEVATTPYAGGMIQGAQDAARRHGYMLLTVSADDAATMRDEIDALKRYGVDGFFYSTMSNRRVDIPESLDDYPLVIVDASQRTAEEGGNDSSRRFPSIEPDEFRIGYDATSRLLDAGCRRIAYIGFAADDDSIGAANDNGATTAAGDAVDGAVGAARDGGAAGMANGDAVANAGSLAADPTVAQAGRLAGYLAALADRGVTPDPAWQCNVGTNGAALAAVARLFEEVKPDGFFCFNDSRALYVYEQAARHGLEIGRDISVVGVDNHRVLAETLSPQLTTIELPHYEMGYWAALQLISMVEGRELSVADAPAMTAPLPPLEWPVADDDGNDSSASTAPGSLDVKIHCTLIDKESVAPAAGQ
ncbi:LacI family DNA-binding transcriptional regulator [Bifidobacterium choloepi]|uniref:LacI family DNA-binding transcriptional regulator n=1 Tax=Bifidobacterium choloepi TaxID=2614131 RepID=A0A6I5N849_9BIFI|nr:LacI family DNA-binding transcriptional regulator [Bifidobacterium choloepi]NEG70011.1 LacI family DNA-binding transcriptional regulator [Bifidobacterium choloepi]